MPDATAVSQAYRQAVKALALTAYNEHITVVGILCNEFFRFRAHFQPY